MQILGKVKEALSLLFESGLLTFTFAKVRNNWFIITDSKPYLDWLRLFMVLNNMSKEIY